jgi:hypothetical protein
MFICTLACLAGRTAFQCGGDEEFLRELLSDLKDEVAENVGTVMAALEAKAQVLKNSRPSLPHPPTPPSITHGVCAFARAQPHCLAERACESYAPAETPHIYSAHLLLYVFAFAACVLWGGLSIVSARRVDSTCICAWGARTGRTRCGARGMRSRAQRRT